MFPYCNIILTSHNSKSKIKKGEDIRKRSWMNSFFPFLFFPGFDGLPGWGGVGQRRGSAGGRSGSLPTHSERSRAALQFPQSCSSQKLAYGPGYDLHPQCHRDSDHKRFPQGDVHHDQAEDPRQEPRVQSGDQPVQPRRGLHPSTATGETSEPSTGGVSWKHFYASSFKSSKQLSSRVVLALQKRQVEDLSWIMELSSLIHHTAF